MMNPNTLKLNWTTCKYHQNQKNENIPYLRPSLHLHSWSFPVQLPDKLNKVLSTLNLLQYSLLNKSVILRKSLCCTVHTLFAVGLMTDSLTVDPSLTAYKAMTSS